MTHRLPRIWALLGHRIGDNLQILALAQALGLPFETRTIRYNLLRKLDKRLLGSGLASVRPEARRWLRPPWPDLVIGIGHRSVPVARYIRERSGDRCKLVQLGNPRLHPRNFDLVITTPQYPQRMGDNVLTLPLAMASPHSYGKATAEEAAFLDSLPRPHRLIVLGGPTKLWLNPPADVAEAANRLAERSREDGGTVIAVRSPRTSQDMLDAIDNVFTETRHRVVRGNMPRYGCLLRDADEIYATADSVSMLSEAVFTGKPVGVIRVRPSTRGRRHYALAEKGLRRPPFPNLKNFWADLETRQLVGTVDHPRAGDVRDPAGTAAAAVRKLLGLATPPG